MDLSLQYCAATKEDFMIPRTLITFILSLFAMGAYAQDDIDTVDEASDAAASTIVTPARPSNMDEMRWHAGVLGGMQDPDGKNDPAAEYGLDIGMQPYIPIGIGAELSTSSNDDLTRTKLLPRATYNFGGGIPIINRSYIGAAAGAVWDSDTEVGEGMHFAWAPVLGFDIPFGSVTNNTVSLGLQGKYLAVEGDAPDAVIVDGAVKYWF
jgi:hypothetical protein